MKLFEKTIHRMSEKLRHTADKRYLPEMLIYIAVWTIVLLFPLVEAFFDLLSGSVEVIRWKGIFMLWTDVIPFLLLFLLNNCVLAPRLFLKQKVGAYIVVAILSAMLLTGLASFFGSPFPDGKRQMIEARMQRSDSVAPSGFNGRPEHGDFADRPDRPNPDVFLRDGGKPDDFHQPGDFQRDFQRDFKRDDFQRRHKRGGPFFFPLVCGPFFGRMMIALLMLSFNIAVKLFFKSLRDKEAMKELERHNLQSELEYLKYQINPHFFMNTLNNIHALVDIDAEKAKETLVELSKLMRYVLYEANNPQIALSKEVQFLRHYVELMRIRYPECVRIELELPGDGTEVMLPPLLFISFVENAFKHGVSYQKDSFISIRLELDGESLLFRCFNTQSAGGEDKHHGIGLENVRKRLQLLFGSDYKLSINEDGRSFEVLLAVPVSRAATS